MMESCFSSEAGCGTTVVTTAWGQPRVYASATLTRLRDPVQERHTMAEGLSLIGEWTLEVMRRQEASLGWPRLLAVALCISGTAQTKRMNPVPAWLQRKTQYVPPHGTGQTGEGASSVASLAVRSLFRTSRVARNCPCPHQIGWNVKKYRTRPMQLVCRRKSPNHPGPDGWSAILHPGFDILAIDGGMEINLDFPSTRTGCTDTLRLPGSHGAL